MNRITRIVPADRTAMEAARQHWNCIAKPIGSLGLLEKAVIRIAGMTGNPRVQIENRCAVILCADNGVVAEGVTQTDSEVTGIVAKAIAEGTSNISRMAQTFGARVLPVDIGMRSDTGHPGILPRKIARGTANIAEGAAMTREQAEAALSVGIDLVKELKEQGVQIVVTGEMGIGNTTTSSALASVLLNKPAKEVTGRGAGLDRAGLNRKIEVIKRALAVNQPDPRDPMELLSCLGGFDIAGMAGLFLGGAIYHMPIIIDGLISAAAAVLAARIAPLSKDYMLASHVSKEPAGQALLEELGLKPIIFGELCLGEGTGGILLLPLLDGALSVYHSAHRFEELPMESYREFSEE